MGHGAHHRSHGGRRAGYGARLASFRVARDNRVRNQRPRVRLDRAAFRRGHRMTTTRTPWTVTVLMAIGTYAAMFAMSTLVDGSSWLRTVFFVLLLVTGADLAVRAATRSRLLPTLAALVAAVVVMIPL